MDMQVNHLKLKQLRETNAWSQSHLAEVSGLSLRTIQRMEKNGIASPESVKSVCASFNISTTDLLCPASDAALPLSPRRWSFSINRWDIKASITAGVIAFVIAFSLTA